MINFPLLLLICFTLRKIPGSGLPGPSLLPLLPLLPPPSECFGRTRKKKGKERMKDKKKKKTHCRKHLFDFPLFFHFTCLRIGSSSRLLSIERRKGEREREREQEGGETRSSEYRPTKNTFQDHTRFEKDRILRPRITRTKRLSGGCLLFCEC